MATKSFSFVPSIRYDASGRITYNGRDGIVWVQWVKLNNAWVHNGSVFMPVRATRQDIVEAFYVGVAA
jgi:hypothetical protein